MTTYEVCLTLVGKKLVSVKETPLGMPTLGWRGVYASTLQIEDERVAVEEGAGAIDITREDDKLPTRHELLTYAARTPGGSRPRDSEEK